mmetsp:Transcript_18934/g.31081  ORF Transcript_18934/g.31081 Transcript_18934/m.31081 type:complete len:107 (+) Transcript_18934:9-329(+)
MYCMNADLSTHIVKKIIFMLDLNSKCFVGILTPSNTVSKKYGPVGSFELTDDSYDRNQVSSPDASESDHGEVCCEGTRTRLPCGKLLHLDDDFLRDLIFDIAPGRY